MNDSTTSQNDTQRGASSTRAGMHAQFGMNSFSVKDYQQFGQNVKLAMACMEGSAEPEPIKAMPLDEAAIRQRLKALSQDITSQHADLLELLVRFDDLEGWKNSGAKHCAGWMNMEIGVSLKLGWEYLRVGRKLRLLPTTTALFRAGKLSWSKIRLIASVADSDNEKILCHAALDAPVSDVKRFCAEYRWVEDSKEQGENERALKQWDSRALTWDEVSNGSTRIQLILPPESAQAYLASIQHSLNQLLEMNSESGVKSDCSLSQHRADAAIRMAETSLQAAGKDIATADRFQVIVSVDASELASNAPKAGQSDDNSTAGSSDNSNHEPGHNHSHNHSHDHSYHSSHDAPDKPSHEPGHEPGLKAHDTPGIIPSRKPTLRAAGPIARETARRIACDCFVTINKTIDGELTDIGRKSRIWPNALARGIKERDQHCQFYGCTQSSNLQIHHIIHWADGGTTSLSNGVCVCQRHHTMIHEGGYSIQKVDSHEQRQDEQFADQQHGDDIGMFNVESELRNNRESFDRVRNLSPTRYRFRTINALGQDIRHNSTGQSTAADTQSTPHLYPDDPDQSIRVECREPASGTYRYNVDVRSLDNPDGNSNSNGNCSDVDGSTPIDHPITDEHHSTHVDSSQSDSSQSGPGQSPDAQSVDSDNNNYIAETHLSYA